MINAKILLKLILLYIAIKNTLYINATMKDTVDVEKYLNTPRGKRKKSSKWIEDYLSFMSSNFDNKEIWLDSSSTCVNFKSLYVSFF